MKTTELLEKTSLLWEELQKICKESFVKECMEVHTLEIALFETKNVLNKLYNWVTLHQFEDWKTEIIFFKHWKPLFVSHFILLVKKIQFLYMASHSTKKEIKKEINETLKELSNFQIKNHEFIAYIAANLQHRDREYFIRGRFTVQTITDPSLHHFNDKFYTSHDMVLAQYLAGKEFSAFISYYKKNYLKTSLNKSSLSWSASKVALTELICALHQSHCINGGNIELSVLVRHFEQLFNISLGNYHKTISEIKIRKSEHKKFTYRLAENLDLFLEKDFGI